jgi:pSer/pThr/pTyr-binding forkhead associated (FHA) protein
VDVLDLAILALRLVLVALLYAFVVLVLRTAAAGLWATATLPGRSEDRALRLVVLDAGRSSLHSGQLVDLDDTTTLGRAEQADLVLSDPAVSSEHARLSQVGRAWVVTDLGSTNGTRVNETRIKGNTPLADGDVLAIGTVRLQVVAH